VQAIFATILSIYVLFGSIGTLLYRHSCLVSEEINISFQSQDNCCGDLKKDAQTNISSLDCCEFTSTYLQVNYDAFSLARDFLIEAPVDFLTFTFEIPSANVLNITEYPERGPPLFYGRTLLAFIQSFLI
jgi:hypothetical protein